MKFRAQRKMTFFMQAKSILYSLEFGPLNIKV